MQITTDQILDDVRAALADDPRIPYVKEVAVKVYRGGYVTLRGTVGSFAQRRAAVADARRTPGVTEVYDELRVRPLDRDRRQDAEIRGAALQRLMRDSGVGSDFLNVRVKDGWVTLTGEVDHQFVSDRAFDHVASLTGVTGVTNKITVVEPQ